MSGQPISSKPKFSRLPTLNRPSQRIIENKLSQQNFGFARSDGLSSAHHNICVSTERPSIVGSSNHDRNYLDPYSSRFSKDRYSNLYDDLNEAEDLKDNLNPLFSGNMTDQAFNPILQANPRTVLNGGIYQANTTSSNPPVGPHTANMRPSNAGQDRSNSDIDENAASCYASSSVYDGINYLGSNLDYSRTDDKDENNLFRRPDNGIIDPHIPAIATASRPCATMCTALMNCRTLEEAIDFVDNNRDLIEDLTRIISEAPAYRDYDMSNYMIDYSVKESFNPEFWHDREPVVTTADGNCQYHAVSISLTGSEFHTQKVRLLSAVAVIDYRDWFDSMLKIIDGGSVLDLVQTIARPYSWGDATTLKAIAVAIKRRIFLYTCNIGKKDYEMVKSISKEELLDAFKEKKYRGGTGIHTYADPMTPVPAGNYIMLFHKSEHFIAVLPTDRNPIMYEPYNPIVPTFS